MISNDIFIVAYMVFCLSSCLLKTCCLENDESVNYYLELINKANDDASTYKFPKSSRAYFNDSENTLPRFYGAFDVIIVGGGTAGAVLANRLSEVESWNILLLEAGLPGNNITDVPGMFNTVQKSAYNWGYYTTPQTTCCLGYQNSQCTYPRGKALGGSSTINGLVATRCSPNDYNQWRRDGNRGWSMSSMVDYFLKLETADLPPSKYHGYSGPLHIEYNQARAPIVPYFLAANKELGREEVDYNGRTQYGASTCQMNTRHGHRESTERAYLKPIQGRPNLKIVTEALVTKVVIEQQSKRTLGVHFLYQGVLREAIVCKEVILSAGAINSPQILMLSGIGPKEVLLKHNIKPIRFLPVGQNMHDHPRTVGLFFGTNFTFKPSLKDSISQFVFNGTGLLASPAGVALCFFNTNSSAGQDSGTDPNIEHVIAYAFVSEEYLKAVPGVFGWTQQTADAVLRPYIGKWVWHMVSMLLHPKSRGSVTLASSDPLDFPLIDLNYYSDPEDIDIETHVSAIEDTFRLLQTNAFQTIGSSYESRPLKECAGFVFLSRAYWKCFARHLIYTTYHPGGTCKMGPKWDKTSVVNDKLQVHGIQGLRVVDGSIIPNPLTGHPNVPIVAIAEKFSDIIKLRYSVL